MTIGYDELGNRRGWLWISASVAIALATTSWARAGSVTIATSAGPPSPMAAEVDALAKSIVDVNEAVTRFQKRDFDACLRQLAQARKAHPELPPPHALFAKLAFLSQ